MSDPPTSKDDAATSRMIQFPEPLGGERHEFRWRGHRVCYTRIGRGSPVVLVHSIHAAAWSMEWRHVARDLGDRHTVYAIDLLGFGASDRPPLHYTSQLYVDLLVDFLRDVVNTPASIVGSSLGGTYAVRVAARHPELIRSVSAIGPAGISRLRNADGAAGTIGAAIQGLFRSPIIGERLFAALTSRPSIRYFLSSIYADRAAMTPEAVELFWRGAHADGARFAPAAFVGMRLNLDIEADLRGLTVPMQLIWGRDASQTPFAEAAEVHAVRPDLPLDVIAGGDLPHDEAPRDFLRVLTAFLDRLP